MSKHHWTGCKPDISAYGFLYCITNLINGQKYIGRKFYHKYKKKKRYKESDWRTYTGSSKWLNADIKERGKKNFIFKLLYNFKTRGGLINAECSLLHYENVLTERLENGEPAFYNRNIGAVRWVVPEELSKETRKKLSKALMGNTNLKGHKHTDKTKKILSKLSRGTRSRTHKGPWLLKFRDATSIITKTSLMEWSDKNGYSCGAIHELKSGRRNSARHISNRTKPHNAHLKFDNDVIGAKLIKESKNNE